MTISSKELLPRPPKLKSDALYDPIELDKWFQRLYLLLGQKGSSSAFNIPHAIGTTVSGSGGSVDEGEGVFYVDALMEYGNEVNFTNATIASALTAIGTTNKVLLLLRSGTWVFSANVNWSAYTNVTLFMVPGALISHSTYTINWGGKLDVLPGQHFLTGTGAVTMPNVPERYPQWYGGVGDGVTDDSAAIGKAIVAASGKILVWSSGTYAVSAAIVKTLTGSSKWIADGPVVFKAITNKISVIMQIEVDSFDLTIEGPMTFDCNNLARIGLRVNNDSGITDMTEAANLYIRNVKAINAYSDLNSYGAFGIYAYGAFNVIEYENCSAININRAAALTGSPATMGLGYGHGGVNKYAKQVTIIEPYIDTITSADVYGDATYVDMDGINVTGPSATDNSGVKMPTSLTVRGGTFINCQGRSIKTQMESNTVDSPTFIRDGNGKMAMSGGQEVDFQYGSGSLLNFKVKYGLASGGVTPLPTSWAIVNATVRGYATKEGALIVRGGEITNNIPQATDTIPYFVTLVRLGGTFQAAIVSDNIFLGVGGISEFINTNSGEVNQITANRNYINDLGVSLIYSAADYSATIVHAEGNYLTGTARRVTDGGSTCPPWYGLKNHNFSTVGQNPKMGVTTSVADGGTITHYLLTTPTTAYVTGSVAGEIVTVTAIGSTTITVAIKKHDGSAGTTQSIYWTVAK